VVAREGFAVLAGEVAPPAAEVGVEVEDALVGKAESAASVVNFAAIPVAFVQTEGGVVVPATKLTSAHYRH
jgi:hypothetical protein